MTERSLADWLAWQREASHAIIDLGLERLHPLVARLGVARPAPRVIVVAGTNGKGSSVAFLSALLTASGLRVGAYTSPHLEHFNERVVIAGQVASDAELCAAFAAVDAVRGEIMPTPFEFITLAALWLFARSELDVVVLEVGLGGRLDAVNVIAADAALITPIGIDHSHWLGPDREAIGREKAGVLRPGQMAVCADADPPQSLLHYADELGARLLRLGVDYGYDLADGAGGEGWRFWFGSQLQLALPLLRPPGLVGRYQYANAAGALALLLHSGWLSCQTPAATLAQGLAGARLAGRFEHWIKPKGAVWILDVAHNPLGASALAEALTEQRWPGRTLCVFAALADKEAAAMAAALASLVDHWYLAELSGPRGRSAVQLADALRSLQLSHEVVGEVATACAAAAASAGEGDRVVVWGSFHTVLAARHFLRGQSWTNS